MSAETGGVSLLDLEPAISDFLEQAIAGLSTFPRTLPSKFFYDERGSDLFQEICELPEYYVTRTETEILRKHGAEMADSIGENAELVGFGTGAGVKTRMLLDHLKNLIAYVPVDISKQRLTDSAEALSRELPSLKSCRSARIIFNRSNCQPLPAGRLTSRSTFPDRRLATCNLRSRAIFSKESPGSAAKAAV